METEKNGISPNEMAGRLSSIEKLKINISDIKLTQDFSGLIDVKKVLTTVPVRKPDGQTYIRVHSGEESQFTTMILEIKEDRESYLVKKDLWVHLGGELVPKLLVTAITRQGIPFIWPIRLPGHDGKIDAWNRSAHEAARIAQDTWVRVKANMGLGGYEIFAATSIKEEPEWPEILGEELLQLAFKDNYISTLDHPVLRRLRGEL